MEEFCVCTRTQKNTIFRFQQEVNRQPASSEAAHQPAEPLGRCWRTRLTRVISRTVEDLKTLNVCLKMFLSVNTQKILTEPQTGSSLESGRFCSVQFQSAFLQPLSLSDCWLLSALKMFQWLKTPTGALQTWDRTSAGTTSGMSLRCVCEFVCLCLCLCVRDLKQNPKN